MKPRALFLASLFIVLALPASPVVRAAGFTARVVEVEAGDRIVLLAQGRRIHLSLYGIRCPSPEEPYGPRARALTAQAVLQKEVEVEVVRMEDDSHVVGSVLLPQGGRLAHQLLRRGLASWNKEGAPDAIKLQTIEDIAKRLGLGLWAGAGERAGNVGPVAKGGGRKGAGRAASVPRSLVLAGLAAAAAVVFVAAWLLLSRRRRRPEAAAPPPGEGPAARLPAVSLPDPEEMAEAIESREKAIQELLQSLSELVTGLVETNTRYDDRMQGHKTSIDKAMTMAGLEEIKRLLVAEIEEMRRTTEGYRHQLEEANQTIMEQQKIMEGFLADARVDYLTKVANRRAFQERLEEEFERAKRYHGTFSLIMLDIDHFKKVNDRFGHLAGDRVLRLLARVLEDQTRLNDFVARYGGEEFTVLLPETTIDQGCLVADKIRLAIQGTSLKYGEAKIKVTVSAGVGEADTRRDDPESLIERVDAALYRAKGMGRNRVESAGPKGAGGSGKGDD